MRCALSASSHKDGAFPPTKQYLRREGNLLASAFLRGRRDCSQRLKRSQRAARTLERDWLGLCAVILSDIPTIITRPFSQCPISGLIASGGRLDRRPRHVPLARENIPHISHLTGSTPPPGPDVIPNFDL